MKGQQILELWRQHKEVLSFSKALLSAERQACAQLAEDNERKFELRQIKNQWVWVSPAAEAIKERDMDDDIQDYKKEWVSITEEEVESIFNHVEWLMKLDFDKDRPLWCMTFAQLVDKKLKDKNS